jgi:multidrug resistance efflux pump
MDYDREFLAALDQNKKDMKSLREAVDELGKGLQTLTAAVQGLTSQLIEKAKPVIPRPARLRAIRER